MRYEMPLKELFMRRFSCRQVMRQPIARETVQVLKGFIEEVNEVFPQGRICLVEDIELGEESRVHGRLGRLPERGTYLLAILKNSTDYESLGYRMEQVILKVTELGLATCWLGGPFTYPNMLAGAEVQEDEMIVIASPVGYFADTEFANNIYCQRAEGNADRKAYSENFFLGDVPMERAEGLFAAGLEGIRLSPSAINRQPWRITVAEDRVHFALVREGNFAHLPYDIQRVDMGIAMCHFDLAMSEQGVKGCWIKEEKAPVSVGEYIKTWEKTK